MMMIAALSAPGWHQLCSGLALAGALQHCMALIKAVAEKKYHQHYMALISSDQVTVSTGQVVKSAPSVASSACSLTL